MTSQVEHFILGLEKLQRTLIWKHEKEFGVARAKGAGWGLGKVRPRQIGATLQGIVCQAKQFGYKPFVLVVLSKSFKQQNDMVKFG